MDHSGDEPLPQRRWARVLESKPATQSSATRRVGSGVIALLVIPGMFHFAVTGSHPRGPWFGAFAVLVYANLFGWVLLAPSGLEKWGRRRREEDAVPIGPLLLTFGLFTSLMFVPLGMLTSLPLIWCAAISIVIYFVVMGLYLLRTRHAHGRRSAD